MDFNLSKELEKDIVFEQIASFSKEENFDVVRQDQTRPWGGFFVIDKKQAKAFALKFFPHLKMSEIQITNKLSPKILVVAPNKRLFWKYHFGGVEIWTILSCSVGIKRLLPMRKGNFNN